jgi:hypothetical protein
MSLTEIEFELPARQFSLMGYPNLRQGQPLTFQLETRVLSPSSDESWYVLQRERLDAQYVRIGRAHYAFTGQIVEAEIVKEDEYESGALLVQCGAIPLRVLCAPGEDGRLPYGTWETRYLTGHSIIVGIVEDDFGTGVGKPVTATVWSFRRLVLNPGDSKFGEWYETDELPSTPYELDRVLITARLHRPLFQ